MRNIRSYPEWSTDTLEQVKTVMPTLVWSESLAASVPAKYEFREEPDGVVRLYVDIEQCPTFLAELRFWGL